MRCIVCDNQEFNFLHKGTRDLPDIDVYQCCNCGGGMLSSFDHISDSFYEESGMRQENEASLFQNEQIIADDFRRAEYVIKNLNVFNKTILDFGCGYAGFLKLLKPYVNKTIGVELEKSAREYATKNDILVYQNLNDIEEKFDIITSFHVIEHLIEPKQYLLSLKDYLKEEGKILIETPNINDALISKYHSSAFSQFTFWSCHVFLYSQQALELLLEECGYKIEWSKQIQRYSLANHLYWLSESKPGGHKVWKEFCTDVMEKEYERILAKEGLCDTLLICAKKKK